MDSSISDIWGPFAESSCQSGALMILWEAKYTGSGAGGKTATSGLKKSFGDTKMLISFLIYIKLRPAYLSRRTVRFSKDSANVSTEQR